MHISDKIRSLGDEADRALAGFFADIAAVSRARTEDVLDAFRDARVTEAMFAPSTGYGYGDRGREAIDEITAKLWGAQAALVRHNIISGTHALAIALFALLRPNDTMISVTGAPYDTLFDVISGSGMGSLKDFGVRYREIPLADGKVDKASLESALSSDPSIRVVYMQRSRGYGQRRTLTVAELDEVYTLVKARSDAYVVVDNCYGEFTESTEPKGDLVVGSLIKNPGGGFADCGGVLAGSAKAVELAAYRLTVPGIGGEAGATLGQNRNILRGLFYAPHTTAQALMTAHFAAYVFGSLGYEVSPGPFERRSDIIQTVQTGSAEALVAFCRGIQSGSPVDAFVSPEPWDMPGYSNPVVMAAGTFVSGASIELSADGPIRPPYTVFFQGGLTYESARLGILSAATAVCGG